MSARWIRIPARREDNLTAGVVAGALAVAVGVVTFYFARILLAREPLDPPEPPGSRAMEAGDEGGERG